MMKQKLLNEKQKKLFKLYFTNNEANENGIDIKKVIHSVSEYHNKWDEFLGILRNYCPEFRHTVYVNRIELINYHDTNYLIVQFYSWTYLCIDLDHKKQVVFKNSLYPFSEQFFITNFSENKVGYAPDIYYSVEFLEGGLLKLLDFVTINKNLFLTSPYFKYKLEEEDQFMTYLDFSLLGGNLTLYFGDKYMVDDINSIKIDTNLVMQDVSNVNNLSQVKKMCSKLKDIKIPTSIIPKFLLESILFQV
ncbi:MAG: hypothetical protein HFJ38_00720 [Bacilli bacterium]|mgnify:CR=1 FL=1|nr:hypothetical protein [Bacilli bacterium]